MKDLANIAFPSCPSECTAVYLMASEVVLGHPLLLDFALCTVAWSHFHLN